MTMKEALSYAKELDYVIIPYECAEGIEFSRTIISEAVKEKRIGVFIGPEGGFAPEEEALFLDNGMPGLGLGPYIMRLETAALAGMVYLGQTARRKLEERESCAR